MKIVKKLFLFIIAIFVVLGGLWKVSRSRNFQFFGEIYSHGITAKKQIAITFDDGPNANNTEQVLSVLGRHQIPATFFMIGEEIERYPEIAKQVVAARHQIGNHSYSHHRMLLQSPEFCRAEIEKTNELIRKIGYRGEIVFRPPYGKKFFSLPYVLSKLGMKSITWSSESEDTESQDPALLEANVIKGAGPGAILLFHDGGKLKPGTLEAIEAVIQRLLSDGYQFVTVNELLRP